MIPAQGTIAGLDRGTKEPEPTKYEEAAHPTGLDGLHVEPM